MMVKERKVECEVSKDIGERKESHHQLFLAEGRNTNTTRTTNAPSDGKSNDQTEDDCNRKAETKDSYRTLISGGIYFIRDNTDRASRNSCQSMRNMKEKDRKRK